MRSARSAESPRPSSCCKATKNSSPAVWVPNNSACSGLRSHSAKMGFCELSTDSSRKATAAKVAWRVSSAVYPADSAWLAAVLIAWRVWWRNASASVTPWRLARRRTMAVSTSWKRRARFSGLRVSVAGDIDLVIEHYQDLKFGIGKRVRDINPNQSRLQHVVPTGTDPADPKILRFDAPGNGRRRYRQMGQRHAGQGTVDEFAHESRGADLDQLRGLRHEFALGDAGADGEHPAGIAHAARVGDRAFVITVAGGGQRDRDAVSGQHGLQVGANVEV